MAAAHVGAVAGRIVLVQLRIAQQPCPRVTSFQKIVAEDPILGEAPTEGLLERIDVVDPLADERAFAEHVLVDVRDGTRVRVDAGLPAVQSRIARAVRTRQADRHARLQDAVALDDAPLRCVVAGMIQRVCHGADELPRRIARKLRIRVQGDDVLHVGQDSSVADDERKAAVGNSASSIALAAAQQRVQVRQLAALALVTHPDPFLRVPPPRAMEEEEIVAPGFALSIAIFLVQLFDPRLRQPYQRPVLRERFLVRVAKIGQQAEVQAFIPIRQEPDFQRLDQILDALSTGEHGRNHHQRARLRRDPFGEVHFRQRMRRHQQGCQPVHQRHGQLTGDQQREHADRQQYRIGHRSGNPCGKRLRQEASGDDHRDQHDGAEIQEQGEPAGGFAQRLGTGQANIRRPLDFRQALVDQVEADVTRPMISAAFSPCARQLDRLAGHLALRQAALLRYLFRCMAVAIAGGKIHPAIDAARIVEQRPLDDAHGLDELAPVDRAQNPKTADAVADGDLVGGLLLILRLHHALDRQARLGESLLDPGQRQCQGRAPPLQATRELRDERAGQRRIRARHVRDDQNQALRILLGGLRHLVRPGVGQVSLVPGGGDPQADATEILDQRQSQHDRDCPQLAKLEGRDALVGRNEAAEACRIYATVAMRNGLQRNVIHARSSGRRSMRQAGELPAVTFRQVPLGGTDLLFDEIEIVEQPFPGRRDPAVLRDHRRQQRAHSDQRAFVRCQPRQELVGRAPRSQHVRGRESLSVLLHLLGAEQLGSERGFLVRVNARQVAAAKPRLPLSQISGELRASVQFRGPSRARNINNAYRIGPGAG